MAGTNYKVYWVTFIGGWNPDGTPIIITKPSKGISLRHAEDRLRQGNPKARMIGQATKEDIAKYKELKSQTVTSR